jgi:hypothetical protein
VRRVLELVALVIAPTTLITALAFYFGWTFTNERASYFGIDPSALGFSTTDYLLRSVDVLYVPLGAVILAALGAVTIHSFIRGRIDDPHFAATRDRAAWACGIVGSALLVLGIATLFWTPPLRLDQRGHGGYLLPPLSPGVGALLIAYCAFLARRRISTTALVLVACLVVLSAFWTASAYARALGLGRAKALERSLSTQPGVRIFSKKRLRIKAKGVIETSIDRDAAYPYKYAGLRLLIRSGGKYFVVPDSWSQDRVAIVLPDNDDIRVEFTPGG